MPDTLKRNVALKISILARQMRKHFDEAIAELGVTRSQWTVIAVVSSRPGATQRVIAEALEISEASAGRLVDRLIAEGLVERKPKEDDRRAHAVFLTDKGTQLTGKLGAAATVSEDATFAGIGDDELEQMNALLDRIQGNLGSPQF
ncbi:MarR family winged helix-turn-helix transcriptional regulator [Croceicoccus sp. Ery5]|jgi:MarR family transcriptional regulator, transcriptional regulator for hemolysin|uniref:MarR family winged helix-turn-helix transcriptional regulator n=1 Tax=Croceicoccus sp. Ery5 TaxID=1703340 RepID=UPI001E2CD940|nr:MarR family winged helix-turn-helix transcriptional regulator [Croceicoccus sp. Ery5]